jgi:hypothetical protein
MSKDYTMHVSLSPIIGCWKCYWSCQITSLHHTYDMVKFCLIIGMDESIYVVCDILVPISSLHKYFHTELPLKLTRQNYNFLHTSHQLFWIIMCFNPHARFLKVCYYQLGEFCHIHFYCQILHNSKYVQPVLNYFEKLWTMGHPNSHCK